MENIEGVLTKIKEIYNSPPPNLPSREEQATMPLNSISPHRRPIQQNHRTTGAIF